MRIIVLSDTHRAFHQLYTIVLKHKEDAGLFLHLGDGEQELEDLLSVFPDLPLYSVRGNCDGSTLAPSMRIVKADGRKILMTHGHLLSVKSGTARLESLAHENGCAIALYGHTHIADNRYLDGLYVMNPGSPSCPREGRPSYGIIDLLPGGGTFPFLVEL